MSSRSPMWIGSPTEGTSHLIEALEADLEEMVVDTVRLQRISIRKKLGLDRRDRNLAGFLRQLELSP